MLNNKQAEILKALAHPTRIELVKLLSAGEKCLCQVLPLLKLEQPIVSQHLAVLRHAGVVEAEKRGLYVFYRLKNKKFTKIIGLIDEILVDELKESQKELREAVKAR